MKVRWKIVMFAAGLAALAIALGGCHLWYQDMLGYMEHWTGTVQVSGLEWSAAPESQKDSGGRVTIPTNASVTATAAIVNPDGYSLDGGFGSEGDTLRSVRIAGPSGAAVLGLASVTESTTTSITLGIRPVSSVTTPASRGLEHTDFTVTFIPTRTENGLASPTPRTLELRYNTPPRMPLEVVYDDAAKTLGWLGKDNIDGWKMVQNADPSLNDYIYWAWPKGITDPKDPDCVSEFHVYVGGTYERTVKADDVASGIDSHRSPVLADYNVYRVAARSGTTIEIYAVDGEGVKSRAAGSGIAPHKITLKAGEGFFASNGTASVELYKAGGSSVAGGDLETPYRGGHYLSGWTRDGSPVTFPLEINAEMELTAQWTPNPPVSTGTGTGTGSSSGTGSAGGTSGTGGGVGGGTSVTTYTVTYNDNGATAGTAPQVQTKLAGRTLNLQGNSGNLTRTGYTFTGWNTQDNGMGADYVVGASYTKDESVTLYAKWIVEGDYEIRYELGGGNNDAGNPASYNVETPTITLQKPTKTGYTFTGWHDGTRVITEIAKGTTGAITLTAQWKANTYTVQFNGNGSDGGSMSSQPFTYDAAAQSLTKNQFTRTGYSFVGWKDSDGKDYTDGQSVSNLTAVANGTVTLTAKWTANTYTVTLSVEGGTGGTGSVSVTHGQTPPKVNIPTKTGYTFGGYWTGQNGTGTQYYDANGNGMGTWQETANTTLYAKWTANTYTVTLNDEGGSGGSVTVTYGQTPSAVTPPTKANHTFGGYWTQQNGGGTQYYDAKGKWLLSSWTGTSGITLYAKWLLKPGTVVRDGLTISGGTKLDKTSEVQVLSEAVDLKDLYKADTSSSVFVENRKYTITPFVMGQYEVTQQLYEAVMGSNPSSFKTDPATGETQELRPVEQVSWYDAVVFCNELSQLVGLEPVYSKGGQTDTSTWGAVPTSGGTGWDTINCDWDANGYRLPTEAEWELAARGGDPAAGATAWKYTYAGSSTIDGVAWYTTNSGSKTHQVGKKQANGLNLYDMSGNVSEWCWDWLDSIAADTPSDGAASGFIRVCRGGSWSNSADNCAFSIRGSNYPHSRFNHLGFRLVRSVN